jgi:hypothetical protein
MAFWDDHEMTVVVGVTVQDHGVMRGPEKDKVPFIFFFAE